MEGEYTYNWDDSYFKVGYKINQQIPVIDRQDANIYPLNDKCFLIDNLNSYRYKMEFLKLFKLFKIENKNFFGENKVYIELKNYIQIKGTTKTEENIKSWFYGNFLPRIYFSIFPESDTTVYTYTQKKEKVEQNGEKHKELCKIEYKKLGLTPVEIILLINFNFNHVYGL